MQHDTEQLTPWFVGVQPARPGWYDVTLRAGWNTVRLLWKNGSWWVSGHDGMLHRLDCRIYNTLRWRGLLKGTQQ
jgi:hypothetical protein